LKPVDQIVFGYPHGDCTRACVASIFELSSEEVPNWAAEHQSDDQLWASYLLWLKARGFRLVTVRGAGVENRQVIIEGWNDQYVVLGGPSPRGSFGHCVVGLVSLRGMEVVHDPHPSRAGLVKIDDVHLFVPIGGGAA
jgi:hypothetical protein